MIFTNFTAVSLRFYSLRIMNSSKIFAFKGVKILRALQEIEKEGERVRKGGRQSEKERDLEKEKVRKGRDRVRKRERKKEA